MLLFVVFFIDYGNHLGLIAAVLHPAITLPIDFLEHAATFPTFLSATQSDRFRAAGRRRLHIVNCQWVRSLGKEHRSTGLIWIHLLHGGNTTNSRRRWVHEQRLPMQMVSTIRR